uniref:serine/arginine repetitive matrix protein 3-like n=1 Tax=Agelaius phoeniceus TaxID=39638 RepID=UPI0023EB301C|nr:serine/arginine repetitive matrix protein 3-like [Agelaius phoeniceus]
MGRATDLPPPLLPRRRAPPGVRAPPGLPPTGWARWGRASRGGRGGGGGLTVSPPVHPPPRSPLSAVVAPGRRVTWRRVLSVTWGARGRGAARAARIEQRRRRRQRRRRERKTGGPGHGSGRCKHTSHPPATTSLRFWFFDPQVVG